MAKNKKKITEEQLSDLIENLNGTCDTLQDAIIEITDGEFSEEDLTAKDLEKIDEEIFRCVDCGWWSEVADMSDEVEDETVCKECGEERNYRG